VSRSIDRRQESPVDARQARRGGVGLADHVRVGDPATRHPGAAHEHAPLAPPAGRAFPGAGVGQRRAGARTVAIAIVVGVAGARVARVAGRVAVDIRLTRVRDGRAVVEPIGDEIVVAVDEDAGVGYAGVVDGAGAEPGVQRCAVRGVGLPVAVVVRVDRVASPIPVSVRALGHAAAAPAGRGLVGVFGAAVARPAAGREVLEAIDVHGRVRGKAR
jgi:hypothetical protein